MHNAPSKGSPAPAMLVWLLLQLLLQNLSASGNLAAEWNRHSQRHLLMSRSPVAAPEATEQPPRSHDTNFLECRLNIKGDPSKSKLTISTATLSCNGSGNLIAEDRPTLYNLTSAGQGIDPAGKCDSFNTGTSPSCFLTLCGKEQTILLKQPIVTDVRWPSPPAPGETPDGPVPTTAALPSGDSPGSRVDNGRRHLVHSSLEAPPLPPATSDISGPGTAGGGPGPGNSAASVLNNDTSLQDATGPMELPPPPLELVDPGFGSGSPFRGTLCIIGPESFRVIISGALISNNSFTGLLVDGAARVTVTDGSKILDNNSTSAKPGAGIAAFGNTSLSVSGHTLIQGNLAYDAHGAGLDAAMSVTVNITGGVRFVNNTSKGVTTRLYSGGGVHAGLQAVVHISDTSFEGNFAQTGGGAVWGSDTSTINIGPGTIFSGNTANSTGADIKVDPGAVLIIADGAGISLHNESVYYLTNNCVAGQVIRAGFCQWCPTNTYSFNTTKECDACPAAANCVGGDDVTPLPGFWQSGKYSTHIHSCPRSEVCLNNRTMGLVCAAGYDGNLCGSCDVTAGYFWDGPFKCGKCMEKGKAVAVYASGAVLVICLICFSVGSTLRDNTLRMVAGGDQRLPVQRASDFLKFLVRHLQYLGIVAGLRVQWPSAFDKVITALGLPFNVATSQIVSIDCLVPNHSNLPDAIRRLLVYLLAPLVILVVVLLIRWVWWVVVLLMHRVWPPVAQIPMELPQEGQSISEACQAERGTQPRLKHAISVAFVVVVFWFYPWFVRVGLSFFACYILDDPAASDVHYPEYLMAKAPRGYWVLEMRQECWVGWHKLWALALGVPCVAVFCFGVPGSIVMLLYTNRHRFDVQGFRAAFGFLYHDIREGPLQVVWEVVSMIQVAIVVAISVFSYNLGAYFSIVLLSICFAVFSVVLQVFKPYKVRSLQTVGAASLACMYVTTCIALTLIKADSSVRVPEGYKTAAGVLGIVINAGFILWCCVMIVINSTAAATNAWNRCKQWVVGWAWCSGGRCPPVRGVDIGGFKYEEASAV